MTAATKLTIRVMLADAYNRLGIRSVIHIEERIQKALDYLNRDREHYIEVAETDVPDHRITGCCGCVCKLIPIARSISRDRQEDRIKERTEILMLMVAGEAVRYVSANSSANFYTDPQKNSYTYPTYRYVELEDIRKTLLLSEPDEIRPAASAQDWEAYGMIFSAFARYCRNRPIHEIPRNTEWAMLAYARTFAKEVTVDGKNFTGKVIPLAEGPVFDELRDDHRYCRRDELCLLVTEDTQQYLLKSRHTYRYFRKVIYDDVPGGYSCEPTEERHEITYSFTQLEDVRQDMSPFYY